MCCVEDCSLLTIDIMLLPQSVIYNFSSHNIVYRPEYMRTVLRKKSADRSISELRELSLLIKPIKFIQENINVRRLLQR